MLFFPHSKKKYKLKFDESGVVERFSDEQAVHTSRQVLFTCDLDSSCKYAIKRIYDDGTEHSCSYLKDVTLIENETRIAAKQYFDTMPKVVFDGNFSLADLGILPYHTLIDAKGKSLEGKWNARNWLEVA